MTPYRVVISQTAEADLEALLEHVAAERSAAAALRFIDAVEAFCLGLSLAPKRGRSLDRGRRLVGFQRKVSIIFRIEGRVVRVVRIAYRGRDVSQLGDER